MTENPKTNADRIREMSDEELSEKISRMAHCVYCPIRCGIFCTEEECKAKWLSWLRSPVEESEEQFSEDSKSISHQNLHDSH